MPVKQQLKISIITTSFNHARFLGTTISSVMRENYPRLEYLLLDGGSTDNSPDIIRKYASVYPDFIKWRSHPDAGHAAALNEGWQKVTGDIVAFINSDDYYLPGSFSAVSDYFNCHPDCRWLVGDCRVFSPKLAWTFTLKHLWPIDRKLWPILIFNTINQPAVFLRRDFIRQIGLFNRNLKYSFDYDYWLRCARVSLPHRLHRPLAVFRIHSRSIGSTNFRGQFIEDLAIVHQYTRDSMIILCHWLIALLTISAYSVLKNFSLPVQPSLKAANHD